MKCNHCEKFQSLKNIAGTNGEYRQCGKKSIARDGESCDLFELRHIVFCPKKNKFKQLHIDVCLHYQMTKGCKCKLGLEIRKYKRGQPGKLIKRRKQ